jgi:galactose-1-phosphate uridylyltransferase
VVSGKKLLSQLRRRVQETYGINFGNERLADGFTADEVPEEIAEALRSASQLSAGQ